MRSNTAALESNINVTPLVDVCLVLLIIFMVLTPMMGTEIPIDLPQARTAEKMPSEPLKITVKADGTVYISVLAVRAEQVPSELRAMYESIHRSPSWCSAIGP